MSSSIREPSDWEPPDEWVRVGEFLGAEGEFLAARTPLGRLLRRAVIVASMPDASERELDAIRELTAALERLAEGHRRE